MKKILIISPHFPPSNLAAVHRSRLFAQHLPSFGWEPIILTVAEKYYEEALDYNLEKLLPDGLHIEKVKAFGITRPRLIGDIGLRGFFQLYSRAKKLIRSGEIDFLYIPIPSYYVSLLGRWLHASTGIPYGIDYIDPWVHKFPGSQKIFSRHWFSTQLAKYLEKIAVKRASLITGVAEGYYSGVLARNAHLNRQALVGAMPYGSEIKDHEKLAQLAIGPYLFVKNPAKIQLVYAGAMLPKAYAPLEAILKAISNHPAIFSSVEFHFIGTGSRVNDAGSYNIKTLAEKYGLWQTIVFEYPQRIPYADVLVHLSNATAIFILGSTEPHYTPSKTFQGVLSGKPIVAVLHSESTAVNVIRQSGAGLVLGFEGEKGVFLIEKDFAAFFEGFKAFIHSFDNSAIRKEMFDKYSAKNITGELADLLDQVMQRKDLQ